jgi:predicted amidohydrolase YtcJ
MTTSTLYRGGFVYAAADAFATAFVVSGTKIAWIGSEEAASGHADGVDAVVDLDGALVTPTFVDAHVHLSATGLGLRGVDLSDVPSLGQALERIESAARKRAGRPVYAPNWDEQSWPERRPPTGQELDRATYGGVAYLPRVDGHSAVVSSALAAASGARSHQGWNDSGLVTREAHHAARDAFRDGISTADRRADINAAMSAAAAAGIGLVHENGGPTVSSEADFADVLAAGERGGGDPQGLPDSRDFRESRDVPDSRDLPDSQGPHVIGYWGELVADEGSARALVSRMGAHGLAGDLNVDGSIGSRTASLREPYADTQASPHDAGSGRCGNSYLSVEQVRDHVAACSLAGVQAGFHVIGDAGADTVIAGFQAAARQVSVATVAAARHRLEHLEMVDAEGIKTLVELGVTASAQPAFHARWGGPEGMYAARLGRDRADRMNPFATMASAGMPMAFGSDSPVTPFAPWEAIRAAVNHHEPAQRISAESAFLAHTRGGWRAAGIDDRGYLAVGQPASFALWLTGNDHSSRGLRPGSGVSLPDLSPEATLPTNLRTVIEGRTVFDHEGDLG